MHTKATVTALELRCEPEDLLRAVEKQIESIWESGNRDIALSFDYRFDDFRERLDRLRTNLTLTVVSPTLTASSVLDSALEQFLDCGEKEESGVWSHRAPVDRWQDDFASDFEETD